MNKLIKKLVRNIYVQGGFFLTLSSLAINFINYLFHFSAARILKPAGYGNLIAFYSYSIICSIPISVFTIIIIQKINSCRKNYWLYTGSIINRFNLLVKKTLPLLLLFFLLLPFLPSLTNLPLPIAYLIFPSIILSSILGFYYAVFQGLKIFWLFSLLSFSLAFLKLVSIFIPLFHLGQLFHVLLLQTVTVGLALIISMLYTKKNVRLKISKQQTSIKLNITKVLVNRQFFITLFSILATVIISNYDVIFVKKHFSANITGLYGAWTIFSKITYYLVGPIFQVVLVFFSGRSTVKTQEKVLYISAGLISIVGILTYFSYKFIGERFILVLFGSEYKSIYAYLGYASLYGIAFSYLNLMNTYFLAKNSYFALLLPMALPIYLIFMSQVVGNIQSIMYLNIYFAFSVFFLYVASYVYFRLAKNKTII